MSMHVPWQLDSYLGTDPICDICKKPIKSGDMVIQMFIGAVELDSPAGELGIKEETYYLVHSDCEKQRVN